MHSWEAIEEALEYIEVHLTQDIRVEEVANEVNLSVYYFQRLFKRLVKRPVTEYIKLRRLAKASEEIKGTNKRIIDIAFTYGFANHPSFTRAFKDNYGITPETYRKSTKHLNHFVKPNLSILYQGAQEDVPMVFDGILVEITRKQISQDQVILGFKGQVEETELAYGKSTGTSRIGDLWEKFHQEKMGLKELIVGEQEYGIIYKAKAREGCFMYLAGALAKQASSSQGLDTYTLEQGEYLVCQVEAESFQELIDSAIYKAAIYMNQWIVQQKVTCGAYALEVYYGRTDVSKYMELWMPVKPSSASKPTQATKKKWDKTHRDQKPTMSMLKAYVNNDLFVKLCEYIEQTYQSKPSIDFSQCSMQYGWNIKYKKAGRSLCTLYPESGSFIALIVIGEREVVEIEGALPFFTEYTQKLYQDTKSGMGQKWLMVDVADAKILEDVKYMIDVRRGSKARMYK